jgi:hypothetical protein
MKSTDKGQVFKKRPECRKRKSVNNWEALELSQWILNKPKSDLYLSQLKQHPRGILNIYK